MKTSDSTPDWLLGFIGMTAFALAVMVAFCVGAWLVIALVDYLNTPTEVRKMLRRAKRARRVANDNLRGTVRAEDWEQGHW